MFSNSVFIIVISAALFAEGFDIILEHNGPAISGGTISFWAKIENAFYSEFQYQWEDNAPSKRHAGTIYGNKSAQWNITYTRGEYDPGLYVVNLEVCEKGVIIIKYWPCYSKTVSFNITEDLNGKLELLQNNTFIDKSFVVNTTEVEHKVFISDLDSIILKDNNYTTVSYWFMNCTYLGMSADLKFRFNYTVADEDVTMKAIVVAAQINETTNVTDVLPESPWSNSTLKVLNSTSVEKDNDYTPWPDGSCNRSYIPKDPNMIYGYFHHIVKPRRPLQVTGVGGNTWLQNGDLLNLTVSFVGSPPYYHCIKFIVGEYNATGNETCLHTEKTMTGSINVVHYFGIGDKHTTLFIIQNVVSKTATAVTVTNYIAKKHPQLSVIVVPISCSAIAVILIVFGVAYYIQSKNRYTVEVADFDFSANNDTEYKSFRDRLREAVTSAFTRPTEEEQEEGSSYWSPSRKSPNKPQLFENSDSDTSQN